MQKFCSQEQKKKTFTQLEQSESTHMVKQIDYGRPERKRAKTLSEITRSLETSLPIKNYLL